MVNIGFGEHKAAQQQQHEQGERSHGIGHHQVARQGPNHPKDGDGVVVDEEAQQPEHEHPAANSSLVGKCRGLHFQRSGFLGFRV